MNATNPKTRELLTGALKWIRRIEERAEDLPPSFLDNIDPKPLRKAIEAHLRGTDANYKDLHFDPSDFGFPQ